MMLRILRDKLVRLGRDDDGVAMVVTLAIFMFMWLVCAGVYAIGTAVKTRIHLQNACDAAAYSAAVVQADTLSRIATINRAMSWTYVQMTRRQMDYIVWKWLDHSIDHFDRDEISAKDWYRYAHCGDHGMSSIVLNGHGAEFEYSRDDLALAINSSRIGHFSSPAQVIKNSFYSHQNVSSITPDLLKGQIEEDKRTIRAMNTAEERLIKGESGWQGLTNRIEMAAKTVIDANLSLLSLSATPSIYVFQSGNPLNDYFTHLDCNVYDEARFISWSDVFSVDFPRASIDPDDYVKKRFSKKGVDLWFCRAVIDSGQGIQRRYKIDVPNRPLYATWGWWAWRCNGHRADGTPIRDYRARWVRKCDHVYMRCWCESNNKNFSHEFSGQKSFRDGTKKTNEPNENNYSSISYADTLNDIREHIGVGERADPLILRERYFGKNGTITVGIAVENDNPWASLFALLAPDKWRNGIFSAFSIGKDLAWTPQYTVCIASAKAGYKYLDEDVENEKRTYRISWEDVDWREDGQSWNLCQSDWDAVLIPVRRAETFAKGKGGDDAIWNGDVSGFLDGYLTQIVDSSKMLAGGSKNMDRPGLIDGKGRSLPPDYYRFDQWKELPNGSSWDWERGNVTTEWQIENKNARIDWVGIQKVMFH